MEAILILPLKRRPKPSADPFVDQKWPENFTVTRLRPSEIRIYNADPDDPRFAIIELEGGEKCICGITPGTLDEMFLAAGVPNIEYERPTGQHPRVTVTRAK